MSPIGNTSERVHESAFDVLRTAAAAAVVMIHVLGPYRDQFGEMSNLDWGSAIALNGLLRWCVPVFIMITGALLLSDPRPFEPRYYLRQRLAKVLVPFLWWSVVYAAVAGFTSAGFESATVSERLAGLPLHETYYHLGFFYYFLPLYLLVPLLKVFVDHVPRPAVLALLGIWLIFTMMYLAGRNGPWSIDLIMFGGYLLLGFVLWRYGPPSFALVAVVGGAALLAGDYAVISASFEAGRYDIDRWFSYKTINTVLAASFVFVAGFLVARRLTDRARRVLAFTGRHTLGIYLLHPLFLWPVRELDLYTGHPLVVVPCYAAVVGALAFGASVVLSRNRATAWMVP